MRYLRAGLIFSALLLVSPLSSLSLRVEVAQGQTVQSSKAEADRFELEGIQQFRRGQYAEALQTYARTLKAREQRNDKAGIAAVLNRISEVYVATYQNEAAIEVLTRSRTLHQELGNQASQAKALYLSGSAYYSLKQYPKAVEQSQQALTIQKKTGDRAGQALTLLNLAAIHNDQNLGRKTTEAFQQALTLQDAIQDPYYKNVALTRIALFYVGKGKLDQAQSANEQALKIAQGLQAKGREAKFFVVQSLIYLNQSNYAQAIAQLKPAIAISRQVNDQWNLGQTLSLLSIFHLLQAGAANDEGLSVQMKTEATQSIEIGQEALTIARDLKQPRLEASVLSTLARDYSQLGDNQKAIKLLQASLKISRSVRDLAGEGTALTVLAGVYSSQGESRKNLEVQQRIVEIAREQNDPLDEMLSLVSLALKYSDQPQRGVEIDQQALAVWQKINLNELSPPSKGSAQQGRLFILQSLSRNYIALGNYQTAIDYAQQGVTTARTFQRPDLEVDALLWLAFLYNNKADDYPKSIAAAQKALTIAQQIKNSKLEADTLKTLGDSYKGLSDYASALKTAGRLINIAKQLDNPHIEKDGLSLMRDVYQAQGQFQQAIGTSQQLLTLVRSKNLRLHEWLVFSNLAESYLSLGDTTKAEMMAQQVIAIAKRGGNSSGIESIGLTYLGQVYKLQGHYDQAITIFQTVIAQGHKDKNFSREVGAALSLASIYESLGSYQKVVATIEPYLSQIRARNNRPDEARTLVILGFSYNRLGENQKGKAFVEQGLAIARQLKNPSDESDALARLSEIYRTNNDYQKALGLAQQSLKLAQMLKSPPLAANPQSTIGDIYQNLGDYANSRDYYQQAQATYKQINNRDGEGQALLNLAGVAFAQGDVQKTIKQSQQALTIFQDLKEPRIVAIAQRTLSLGYGESGNEAKAMEATQAYLTFAYTVQNPIWEKDALTLLGNVQRKFGKNQAAIALYQQALAVNTPNSGGNNWGIFAGLARTTAIQQPNTAITFYKQAINGLQEIRRNIEGLPPQLQQSFLQTTVDFGGVKTSDIYRQLADLLITQGRIGEAQQVLELLKVQELNDLTPGQRSASRLAELALNPTEQEIQAKYGNLVAFGQKIRDCKQDCSTLKTQFNTLREQFEAYQQTIQKALTDGTLVRIDERNKDFIASASKIVNAQPGTVLIYPLVLSNKVHLLWASQGGVLSSVTCPIGERQLNRTIASFQAALQSPNHIAAVKQHGRALYDCLIKPLEEKGEWQKNKIQNLVIAADRAINYIPFGALFDGKQFLVERYTTSNVLNAVLTDVDTRLPSDPSVLGLGISEKLDGFSALPNVTPELQAIVRSNQSPKGIYQGNILLNQASTASAFEDNLIGGKYQIVHIATHGEFDTNNANHSYLLFSTGETGKGDRYTVSRIQQQESLRKIHLVILSACQSGRGESASSGIEIQGMSAAFVRDRAKAVIASLWNVNDASTSLLMQQFYKNLATGKMAKAEALRQAQLSLLTGNLTAKDAPQRAGLKRDVPPSVQPLQPADLSHPYHWAPFILIGNSL